MPRRLSPDMWLFGVMLVLLSIGVVMVYSASAIMAADRFHDPYLFLKKQLFWALLGSLGLLAVLRIDYRRLERLQWPILIAAGVLLILVLVPPFAQPINGTRRWFRLGPVSFQPAELAKLALVIYLAAYLARRHDGLASFTRGLLPPLGIAGGLALLVLAQPDLGSCLTLIIVTFGLLFLAGARTHHLGLLVALALPVLVFVVRLAPYRLRRITTFVDPWADPRGGGFQIIQSWLALGSGGLFGRGIGESKQKLFYLPESHTDFIFAVIAEELGFLGALALLTLFVVLIWRGLRVGVRAPDAFGAYLALGITVLIATQTLVNLGVVTGSLPTKGLPLPFISFGGSSLLVTMLSAGVLLNISQHANV
jgi:cell division protein FtsW